jgi:hypothetical protein
MFRVKKRLIKGPALLAGLVALVVLVLLASAGERSSAQAASCWQASIREQVTNLELAGSVLRVSVEGKVGLPVRVRSLGAFETIGYTGTKPEYGPYVAEFAPLSKGTYFIEPEGLGLAFEIWLDGQGYTRVDFVAKACPPTPVPNTPTQTPKPTATPQRRTAARATATPTPTTGPALPAGWHARVVERLSGLETYWSTIAVRVVGRPAGQAVDIRSGNWSATCKTGTKPEHGPDACEFGALHAGTYRLTPEGLGTHLDVSVDLQEFVLVEFYYSGPPEAIRWVGSIVGNSSGSQPTEHYDSAIAVVVAGKPWHDVEIRAGEFVAACTTGYKPEYGPDACEFGGLRAGTYTISPKGLDVSLGITMDGWGWAMVRFDPVTVPLPQPSATPAPTSKPAAKPPAQPTTSPTPKPAVGWQGWIISNTSGQQQGTGVWSVIVVRVINYGGIPVHIRTEGGFEATCVTGAKPEYGPDACDFGGLWPGTYFLQPEGADIELEIEMDGLGWAEVHFAAP